MAKKQYNGFSSFLLCVVCILLGFCVGVAGLYVYITQKEIAAIQVYSAGEIAFHFLELGNDKTGDCTYIKADEYDILIDAGSNYSSIPTITSYLNKYVTDGSLEYVIVTHAHEDHYAGFATNTNTESIFDMYEIGTIIDFSQITSEKADQKMYKNYQRELSEAIQRGAVHYTAQECVMETNGAKQVFEITTSITMTILNQKYYHEASTTENNHSVCTLFTHTQRNFLFTGDLEEDGEESLVELNDLPHVDLYKAGHHGSKTSSHDILLNKITPDICCVCCCAGNVEYTQTMENTFPTQDFIDRISKHTDKVYVTTLGPIRYDEDKKKYVNNGYQSMNGNIVVTATASNISVECSNNNTLLKDTAWFKENRTCPQNWA
ncbi:MAG: MBL fold metallo-hydrolase [Clostridiales bacterium]|nr:MBL fold metallo-hydrolase [Clostridiales bacterium]